jgi:hypothetical protein
MEIGVLRTANHLWEGTVSVGVTWVRSLIGIGMILVPTMLASTAPAQHELHVDRLVYAEGSIYSIGIDGSSRRRLTHGADSDPAALPGGAPLAFVRGLVSGGLTPRANEEIFTLNRRTGAVRRLTHFSGADVQPAWSPRSRQLAFAREVRAGQSRIFAMSSRGNNQRQLIRSRRGSSDLSPAWSPNGKFIAFTRSSAGSRDLYVFDLARRSLRKVVDLGGFILSPTWSPDGKRLAFAVVTGASSSIYTATAVGTGLLRVTPGPYDIEPSWAPRGSRLAFVRVVDLPPPGLARERDIHLVRVLGGEDRLVTTGTDPAWLS